MSKIVYYFEICNLFVQTNLKISEKNVMISGNNELTPEPGRGTVRYSGVYMIYARWREPTCEVCK